MFKENFVLKTPEIKTDDEREKEPNIKKAKSAIDDGFDHLMKNYEKL